MTSHRFIRRSVNHRSARVTVSILCYRRSIGRKEKLRESLSPDRGAEITEDRHGTPAGFFPWLDSFSRFIGRCSVFLSAGTRDSRVNSRRAQRVSSRADLALTRLRLPRITLLESRNPRWTQHTWRPSSWLSRPQSRCTDTWKPSFLVHPHLYFDEAADVPI